MLMKLHTLRPLRWLSVSCLLLLSSGCGWQLQGARHMSDTLMPLYVQLVDSHSDFGVALQARLRVAGVRLTEDATQAQATLHVSKDETGHRVISVSESNTPLEYQVFYNIQIELRSQSGEVLLQEPLSASRSITYNEAAALAKQREERLLTINLAGELADQLLRQIRRL